MFLVKLTKKQPFYACIFAVRKTKSYFYFTTPYSSSIEDFEVQNF